MSITVKFSQKDELKVDFDTSFIKKQHFYYFGMPYPPNDYEETTVYFYYFWHSYKSKQELRRRTRSNSLLQRASLDQSISITNNWNNRTGHLYANL